MKDFLGNQRKWKVSLQAWGIPINLPYLPISRGFPHSSVGKESALQCRRPWFDSWVRKIHWRRDRYPLQYSWAFLVAQLVKNPPAMQETWVQSLGWEDPWRRERLPTPVFWPGEFHGMYSSWGCKESDMAEQLSLHFRKYSRHLG